MGIRRVWVSTQRHTLQRGSVGSAGTRRQNKTAKETREGSFWEEFVILLLLQISRITHANTHRQQRAWGLYLLEPNAAHTRTEMLTRRHENALHNSLSHPHKHMYRGLWYTHPLISDPLLEWLAHLKWDKEEEEVEEGNKSRFTRPVPAPVSNFILQPHWCSTAMTHACKHTCMHTRRTHLDAFFSKIKQQSVVLAPFLCWKGLFPASVWCMCL